MDESGQMARAFAQCFQCNRFNIAIDTVVTWAYVLA